MRRDLSRLSETTFDVLVVGAGIHGACAVWDASLRGHSYLDSETVVLATRPRTHTQIRDDHTYRVALEPEALGNGLAGLLRDPALRERLARQAEVAA